MNLHWTKNFSESAERPPGQVQTQDEEPPEILRSQRQNLRLNLSLATTLQTSYAAIFHTHATTLQS